MKKFIVTAAVAAAMVFTPMAETNAQSVSELQEMINGLMAQIANLQGGSSTTSSSATPYNHVSTLRVGSNGSQVMQLQACMNALGYSTGVVDGAFGPNTASGVMQFQAAKGLAVDGIIGPATGPQFEMACAANGMMTEEEEEETETPSASGFDANDGEEADFDDFDVNDADDSSIQEGSNEQDIAEIDVDLGDGGAVLLERYDVILNFSGADDGDEMDAWDVFETIYLMVDGDVIAEVDADDEDDYEDRDTTGFGTGDDNRLRITGINHVMDADEDHTIVVGADITGSIDLGTDDESEWTLTLDENALRFVDEAGITLYLGEEVTGTEETATFTIEEEGQEDEMTVRDSDDDPEATALQVEDDEKSDWYNIFTFEVDVDEDSSDLEFKDMFIDVTTTGDDVDSVVDDFELRMGGDVFDDWSLTGGTMTDTVVFDLDDEGFMIDADDRQDIELWVEFKAANVTNYSPGETITAEVTSVNVDAWDVEGGEDLDATQLQGAAEGEEHTLLVDGAVVTLNSVSEDVLDSSDTTPEDTLTFTFNVNVEAFDEPVYIPVAAAASLVAEIVDASDNTDAGIGGTLTLSSSATEITGTDQDYFKVSSEDDFTVKITDGTQGSGDWYAELREMLVTSDDVQGVGYTFTGTSIVLDDDEFKSDTVTTLN